MDQKHCVVKAHNSGDKSAKREQRCLLPWGQRHRSLPFRQEVLEDPENDKNEQLYQDKKKLQTKGADASVQSL